MSKEVRKSARDEDSWAAWTCDRERLLRLANVMEKCMEAPRVKARSALKTQDESQANTGTGGEDATSAEEPDYAVSLLALHNDMETETNGPPDAVLADLDPVGLESIALSAGSQKDLFLSSSGFVRFDFPARVRPEGEFWFAGIRLGRLSGVTLRVSGSDPAWVRSTVNELRTELKKGVPGWGRLRHPASWFAYTFIFLVAIGAALWPTLGSTVWLWGLVAVAGGILCGSIAFWAVRRLLPGFEIVKEGQSGRGLAVLLFVGALVAQVPIGILVNKVTQ